MRIPASSVCAQNDDRSRRQIYSQCFFQLNGFKPTAHYQLVINHLIPVKITRRLVRKPPFRRLVPKPTDVFGNGNYERAAAAPVFSHASRGRRGSEVLTSACRRR